MILSSQGRPHGFTLIELLVTISILALLLGMLVPSLQNALSLAKRVKCQSNLRHIALAIHLYAEAHEEWLPVAAPHELGGQQGRVPGSDPWLPAKMFGGSLPANQRPLYEYQSHPELFESPCDKGEPLWWFDTEPYQATSTAFELFGSSYFYASGYNSMSGVASPMGIAKVVGVEFSYTSFAENPLPLGQPVRLTFYEEQPTKKVLIGSIPIHRTVSGVVAPNPRAQWYRRDPNHLWANAAFMDAHVEFVQVFPYDSEHQGVNTQPDASNPYY